MTDIIIPTPDIFAIRSPASSEVIRIAPDGKLFWHGREIETDADFKAAMLELVEYFKDTKTLTRPEATSASVANTEQDTYLGALISAYHNASFDCGAWDEEDGEQYAVMYAACQEAKRKLLAEIARIRTLPPSPHGSAKDV